jgi:gluconate 2-dehydrogenase gamma chain
MTDMPRREVVQLLALAPLAASFTWSTKEMEAAWRSVRAGSPAAAGSNFRAHFFTPHELETVEILVDMIIPADERSGSATDAGVPEFMDYIMVVHEGRQTAMRGGLAWIDMQCLDRFGHAFVECSDAERAALIDDIAWPDRARPEMSQGVAFFNSFRDLTASGFFSSRMGVEDIRYLGNRFVSEWTGCPGAQLRKLGLAYEE